MRQHLSNKQRGTAQTEYLSLFALIVIASLTAIALFGESVQQQFSNLTGEIAGKQTTSTTDPSTQTPTTNADPDNAESGGVIHNATRAAQGLYDGLITQGEGFLEMALHPIDTLEGIATLAYALVTDTDAPLKMLQAEIGNDIGALTSGDPYEVARAVGEYLSPAAMLRVAGKLTKLAKFENHQFKIKCSSFAAGTLVWQQNTQQTINLLAVGDKIYSRNEQNYNDQQQQITHTKHRTAPDYYQVTTETNNTLQVTAEHPFWVQSKGWVEASALNPSSQLFSI